MDRVPKAWTKSASSQTRFHDDYKVKPLPERKRRPWKETAVGRAVMVPIRRLDPYVRWTELVERMLFGLMLHTDVFSEAHEDDSANLQALTVLVIVAVVQNISLLLIGMFWFGFFGAFAFVGRAISDAMISWAIWLLVAYALCKVVFRSRAGFMQLFRTLAYAYVPAIFLFFQVIPLYGVTLAALTYLALIEYGVLALRPALNGSIWKALLASFVGWAGLLIVSLIMSESQLFTLIQELIAERLA
jgi:hypothetical protein